MNMITRTDSYADAVAAGSALLYLPFELRREIFVYAGQLLSEEPEYSNRVPASDINDRAQMCKWLPRISLAIDQFYIESLPIMLPKVELVMEESYTAYNLRSFLQATNTFNSIRVLHFNDPDALAPISAGTALLRECINLQHVWLTFDAVELFKFVRKTRKWTGEWTLCEKAFADGFGFRELLTLKKINKVTMNLIKPDAELDRPEGHIDVDDVIFKGRATWLKEQFKDRGVDVEVECKIDYQEVSRRRSIAALYWLGNVYLGHFWS